MAGVTALGKQVYDLTGREFDLGLLGLVEFAPAALLVVITGAVADRFDRRRVAAIGAAGEAVAALALAWYASTDPTAVLPIFGLVLAFGVARAFVSPATRALPADVVPPRRLPWLVARFSATWQVALIAGPALGGMLYAVDPAAPFVFMAALAAAGGVAVLAVRVPQRATSPGAPLGGGAMVTVDTSGVSEGHVTVDVTEADPVPRSTWHEALEGLRFIRGHPILLGAISLDLFAVLFGGAIALLPAIAEDRLGVGAVGFGWLRAAGGIGAAAVTAVLAVRPLRHRVGGTLVAAVGLFGAATVVLGLTRSYAVAFMAMMILSGADAISVFIRATLVPLVTPADRRGRVLAVENVFIGASNELGAFESGVTGQLLGPAPAIVLGGVATLVVAGTWGMIFPELRATDRFPGDDEA
jgi:MFS family permease